jgi:acyl-CoA synthetase (AMP-forming)/AMP-acid ligase II
MEHRIVDLQDGHELGLEAEGEILVRGRFLMDGLYKRERHEVFTPDGWYPTGDLGWFGSDEHLRFTGRRGAMVKTGGSNVSPAEVEAALAELPGIRTAYVFGVPSGDRGEDVAAVLVPAAGQQIDVTAVTAAARTTLSSYKVPRQFRIVAESELPMLPTGKADLAALRALFAAPPG